MTTNAPRLPGPDPANYSDRQRQIHAQIASGPRGFVRGPLAVWMHRPELADRAQKLGQYCRYDSALAPHLSELAILVTGRIYGAEYEWQSHKDHALAAGISPEAVEAIRQNRRPVFDEPEMQAVHDVARAAHEIRNVDDALYARAVAALGAERMVDLVGLLGYYALISLTINVFRVQPDGPPELAEA